MRRKEKKEREKKREKKERKRDRQRKGERKKEERERERKRKERERDRIIEVESLRKDIGTRRGKIKCIIKRFWDVTHCLHDICLCACLLVEAFYLLLLLMPFESSRNFKRL